MKFRNSRKYSIKKDQTSLDRFVIELANLIAPEPLDLEVTELGITPTKIKSDLNLAVKYLLRLSIPFSKLDLWGFNEYIPNTSELWGNDLIRKKLYEKGSELIEFRLEPLISKHPYEIKFRYSQGHFRYVNISTILEINSYDLLSHHKTNLTEFGEDNKKEISNYLEEIIKKKKIQLVDLYKDPEQLIKHARDAENLFRKSRDIPNIGEGWINEFELATKLAKHFPNLRKQHSPKWLGQQKFDIFIPKFNVAIEYNGIQHYQPVALFGGEEGFLETCKRDQRKRDLSAENGVRLIEWCYKRPINEAEIEKLLFEIKNK